MDFTLLFQHGAVFIVVLGVIFAFSNGFRDSSTIVATVVSTRALSPTQAFGLCAMFEFIGVFSFGSAVASTVGKEMFRGSISASRSDMFIVLAVALLSAITWGIFSWWRAWPTSNNHALFAGIAGASWSAWGIHHFYYRTLLLVFAVLLLSPILGFVLSILLSSFIRFIGTWLTPRVRPIVTGLHIVACLLVSCAHGSNDGHMIMGLLGLAFLLTQGPFVEVSNQALFIPPGIRLLVATAISLGVLLGGRRILRTLGMKFYRIRPLEGVEAQMTSAGTILTCAALGFPASTTQVIAGSILGAGAAKNPRAVRWPVAQDIVLSWVITLPIVAIFSYLMFGAAKFLVGCL